METTPREKAGIAATTCHVGPVTWHEELFEAKWTRHNHCIYPFAVNPVVAACLLAVRRIATTDPNLLEEMLENIRLYSAVAYVETDNYIGFVAPRSKHNKFALTVPNLYINSKSHKVHGAARLLSYEHQPNASDQTFTGFILGDSAIGAYTTRNWGEITSHYIGHMSVSEPENLFGMVLQAKGRGTCIYTANNQIYTGSFVRGIRTGYGIMRKRDGTVTYMGFWLNGVPHGQGIGLFSDHVYWQGPFMHGDAVKENGVMYDTLGYVNIPKHEGAPKRTRYWNV